MGDKWRWGDFELGRGAGGVLSGAVWVLSWGGVRAGMVCVPSASSHNPEPEVISVRTDSFASSWGGAMIICSSAWRCFK
jgi:hypothetical protein